MGWFSGPQTLYLKPEKPIEKSYDLTLADRLVPGVNTRFLFVYKAPETTDWQNDLTNRLAKALTSFLVEPAEGVLGLPQLAGRILTDPETGRLRVDVKKNSSVRFMVNKRPDITYDSLRPDQGFPMTHLKDSIFANGLFSIPSPDWNGGLEAFTAQITYIHGGFVLCVCKHHFLFDGNSAGKVIQWWLERARSYLPSEPDLVFNPPSSALRIHDSSSLKLQKKVPAQEHKEWKIKPNAGPHVFGMELPSPRVMFIGRILAGVGLLPKITNTVWHFSPASLEKLHRETSAHAKTTFSKNDCVSALLWRCVTRARMYAVEAAAQPSDSMLVLAANGRSRLEPKMADDYFGNVVFFAPTTAPVPVIMSTGAKSLADMAVEIRSSIKEKAQDGCMRSVLQMIESQKKTSDVVNDMHSFLGKDIMLTSWEKMFSGVKDLDVGVPGAVFEAMRLPDGGMFDGLAVVLPTFGRRDKEFEEGYRGGLEVCVDLLATHMEALKEDKEWTRFAVLKELREKK